MKILLAALLPAFLACKHNDASTDTGGPVKDSAGTHILLADPTIFYDSGTYYLYGTGGNTRGFLVYTSSDMQTWNGPAGVKDGYALVSGDAYGTQGFWAPQVFKYGGKFYMAYTADEHIAIAESSSPLGPFRQKTLKPVSGPGKQIDPFVFMDEDGKKYLYHVRLQQGNRLFVARLKDDLSDILPETAKECITATDPWENTAHAPWPVTEGPTLLKHRGLYYLFYSANDFRNIDYAVGYATAPTPFGPWQKSADNPIISRHNTGHNGTGHGDFVRDTAGRLFYVLHTHRSDSAVSPRMTALIEAAFREDGGAADVMTVDAGSFRYLFSPEK
ncbi:glycoside hydrolase family 43 protein [Compostibacter hankyongensis]|uniref:Glycoside hydrolase family 43 protein n=1 Tax=Compostibacter hankyongensis TaxID=1007089 RepID=A0ABP8FMI0_9BACT